MRLLGAAFGLGDAALGLLCLRRNEEKKSKRRLSRRIATHELGAIRHHEEESHIRRYLQAQLTQTRESEQLD
jgi:hypothetical protein